MSSEDYLIRQIRQAAAVLARIMGFKKSGLYDEALQAADRALESLTGLDSSLLGILDDGALLESFSRNGILDASSLGFAADLFGAKGEIYSLAKKKEQGRHWRLRSLNWYLLTKAQTPSPERDEVSKKIDAAVKSLGIDILPEKTLFDLFCFYENEGKYAAAKATLKELASRPSSALEAKAELQSFSERMARRRPRKKEN